MKAFYSLKLDKKSLVPLYIQLGDGLLSLINKGILPPKTKLPPIRKMAAALKLNSITVVNAYKYLENKEAVYSHMGSGTYVGETKQISYRGTSKTEGINFAAPGANPALFPTEGFKEAMCRVMDTQGANAFKIFDNDLQNVFFDYAGIKDRVNGLSVVNDTAQAITLIIKNILKRGDEVFIEEPCNSLIWSTFKSHGIKVIPVPTEHDGINTLRLQNLIRKYNAKLIYISTYFQNPTTATYSQEKKELLLQIAKKHNLLIAEEDTQSELLYSEEKPRTLAAMDTSGRVIYIKNFSKILLPGLNICLVTLSDFREENNPQQLFLQKVLAQFMKSTGFYKHISALQEYFGKIFLFTKEFLSDNLPSGCNFHCPLGGTGFWLGTGKTPPTELIRISGESKIIVSPGELYMMNNKEIPYVRLSVAGIKPEDLHIGLLKLTEALASK